MSSQLAFLNYCCSSSLAFYCLEYVFNSKWYLDELFFLKKSWCLWGNHVTKNYLREAGCCSARVCFHIFLHIILIVGLWMVLENAFLFLFFFLTFFIKISNSLHIKIWFLILENVSYIQLYCFGIMNLYRLFGNEIKN